MNLRDLRYLVALADHKHFGRAAAASFVSQPTLSTQIKKLERELGVELVERSPRHIMLTAVGESVVERARVVLRETDNIREVARRANADGLRLVTTQKDLARLTPEARAEGAAAGLIALPATLTLREGDLDALLARALARG